MRINELKIKQIFFILLPVFPLLDFFAPYKIPYLSIAVYTILLWMFWNREFEYYLLLIAYVVVNILSVIVSVILNGLTAEQIYYVLILPIFLILGIGIGIRRKCHIDMLYKMILLYFLINTIIYFFRLIQYRFNFSRVRGGVSIYGGNSAHFIYLAMLFLLKQYKEKRKSYYLLLGISVMNAIMFVSKGAMIITCIWIFMDIICHRQSKIFSRNNVLIASIAIMLFTMLCFYKSSFLFYIINRFSGWRRSYQTSGSIMGERGQIFKFSINYLKENPIFLFFGIGSTNYKLINPWSYSNPHNLFLDVLINSGILGFCFFSCIIIKTFCYVQYRFYYLLLITYATLEGIALFYVDAASRIVTGYAFMFLVIIFIDSQNRRRIID